MPKDLSPPPGVDGLPAPLPDETQADVIRSDVIDRLMHAWQGRFTLSISPPGLMAVFFDWGVHLANAPGKQAALIEKAVRKWVRLALYLHRVATDPGSAPCIEPLPQDRRFRDSAWHEQPFCTIYQAFLLQQQWWHNATTGVRGTSPRHERIVSFAMRQTVAEGGQNLLRGARHFVEAWEGAIAGRKPVGT